LSDRIPEQKRQGIALLTTSAPELRFAGIDALQSNAKKRQYALWNLQTNLVLPLVWKHLQTTERDGQGRFLLSCL